MEAEKIKLYFQYRVEDLPIDYKSGLITLEDVFKNSILPNITGLTFDKLEYELDSTTLYYNGIMYFYERK